MYITIILVFYEYNSYVKSLQRDILNQILI